MTALVSCVRGRTHLMSGWCRSDWDTVVVRWGRITQHNSVSVKCLVGSVVTLKSVWTLFCWLLSDFPPGVIKYYITSFPLHFSLTLMHLMFIWESESLGSHELRAEYEICPRVRAVWYLDRFRRFVVLWQSVTLVTVSALSYDAASQFRDRGQS